MANVLSQDEVDSLLAGIDEGKVETGTDIPEPEKEEDLKAYDFSTQAGPIHLRLPALRIINERLVAFLRTSLSIATGSAIEVNLSSTDSVKFGDFCSTLPLPTSLNIFKMEPLRGFALLVLEGSLVFSFVDTFFGGKGVSHVKLEGRGFTEIETKIVNKVTKIILEDMQRAWSDIHKLEMIYARAEMDPQFAGIVTPDDMVIVIKFTVDLENDSGSIILC
ncbi:MAG: flagellar motor switch protein FliM, partial [Thermodesulfobacteriota bacterium]|nr:flagellar motor switch protein FliM [Thermodesulfobacteriota bacterium]